MKSEGKLGECKKNKETKQTNKQNGRLYNECDSIHHTCSSFKKKKSRVGIKIICSGM